MRRYFVSGIIPEVKVSDIINNEQLNYLYDISKQGLQGMTAGLSSISNNSNSITISDLNIALDNVKNRRTASPPTVFMVWEIMFSETKTARLGRIDKKFL